MSFGLIVILKCNFEKKFRKKAQVLKRFEEGLQVGL